MKKNIVAQLAVLALTCHCTGCAAEPDLTGKTCSIKPQWTAVVKTSPGRIDNLYDVATGLDGSIYLLATSATTDNNSQLIKLDKHGTQLWRTNISEEATAIATDARGVLVSAWAYDRASGDPVARPYILRISADGGIAFKKMIQAPVQVKVEGARNSIWDLNVKGEAMPWRIRSVVGGCVILGVATADKSHLLYAQRLNDKGSILWSAAVAANYDVFAAGPNKTQPLFEVIGNRILICGPFQVEGSQTQSWAAWLDLKTGKILRSASANNADDGNFAYAAAARDGKSGKIALAGKTTITVFNDDLTTAGILKTSAIPSTIAWQDDGRTLMIGGEEVKPGTSANEFMPVGLPTMSQAAGSEKALRPFKTFIDEKLWQNMSIVGAQPNFVYSIVTSKDPHVISKTSVLVKRQKNESWETYVYAPNSECGEIFVRPTAGGFLVIFDERNADKDNSIDVLQF